MNAIELKNVCLKQGSFTMKNVSFALESGYVLGLIGPNGAGKSTSLRMLLGLCLPDSGEALLWGQPSSQAQNRARVGVVFDESKFYDALTVHRNLALLRPFYPTWDDGLCASLLERFELNPRKKVKELSRGMKMKLGFVAAICHKPDLLIMDEPTGGLDPLVRRDMLSMLREYMQNESRSVIFSTHITTDLERIADRIVLLSGGAVRLDGERDAVLDGHVSVKGPIELLRGGRQGLIGVEEYGYGFEAVARAEDGAAWAARGAQVEKTSREELMIRYARKEAPHDPHF